MKSKSPTSSNSPTEPACEYPYLVIRLMPAVYDKRRFVFTPTLDANDERSFQVQWPQNIDRARPLPLDVTKVLIELVQNASKQTGFRMCIVISPDESLYVEPDGRVEAKGTAPSGGIALLLGAAALTPRTRFTQ